MSDLKSKIRQFADITNVPDKVAKDILRKSNNDLNSALETFYNNPTLYKSYQIETGNVGKLKKLFNQYAKGDKKLTGQAYFDFLKDINVHPDSLMSLALPWKLGCKQFAVVEESDFTRGFSIMGADTIQKIVGQLGLLEDNLLDQTVFKSFYLWLFEYLRTLDDSLHPPRSINVPIVTSLWKILFPDNEIIEKLTDYFEKIDHKVVSKDLWCQTLDFINIMKPDFSNHSYDDAWPTILDDFVIDQTEQ